MEKITSEEGEKLLDLDQVDKVLNIRALNATPDETLRNSKKVAMEVDTSIEPVSPGRAGEPINKTRELEHSTNSFTAKKTKIEARDIVLKNFRADLAISK